MLSNKTNKDRLDYLDMVKGIGIILVVAGHSGYIPDGALTWLASFHMPLFFIVSGILFAYKQSYKEEPTVFIKKRARGMLIPYVCFTIIYMVVYAYYYFRYPGLIDRLFFREAALQALSGYGMSVLWFLTAIFFSECLFYMIVRYSFSTPRIYRLNPVLKIGVAIILCVVFAALPIVLKTLVDANIPDIGLGFKFFIRHFIFGMLRVFPGCIFLLMGYCLFLLLKNYRFTRSVELIMGVGFMILNAAIAFKNGRVDMHFLQYNHPLLFYFGALSATLGLILICRNIRRIWFLTFLGANSLIVMATHLDCQGMSNGIRFANIVTQFVPRGKNVIFRFNLCIFLIIFCGVFIVLINKYLYFLLGKKAPVAMETPVFVDKIVRKIKASKFKRIK